MRLPWIVGLLVGVVLNIPVSAQVSVYLGSAPPPVRYERQAPEPGPGYVWVEGYWAPNGHHYRWVPGRWERAPYEGAVWSHPHYDHYQQGWQLHEGHWDHDDHDRGHDRDREQDHDH